MAIYDSLVANGYRLADLDEPTPDELALLHVEEFLENAWSPAARQAAIAARHKRESAGHGSGLGRGLDAEGRKAMAKVLRTRRSTLMLPHIQKEHSQYRTVKGRNRDARETGHVQRKYLLPKS